MSCGFPGRERSSPIPSFRNHTDNAVYDRRYREVFKPAIEKAGLEPYRVDEDPSATIPIDQIETGIRQARVCFAEITSDNPNVWYELGYAIARGKQVILVCAEDRGSRFPFDVQHRKIIKYRSGSPGDFDDLGQAITQHLVAALEKEDTLEDLAEINPVAQTEELSDSEIATLATLAQSIDAPEEYISAYSIKRDVERAGYTPLAVTLALRTLTRMRHVQYRRDSDDNGNEFFAYSVTEAGLDWLQDHQHLLVLKRQKARPSSPFNDDDDDLPF